MGPPLVTVRRQTQCDKVEGSKWSRQVSRCARLLSTICGIAIRIFKSRLCQLTSTESAALSGPGYAKQHCSVWCELAACTFSRAPAPQLKPRPCSRFLFSRVGSVDQLQCPPGPSQKCTVPHFSRGSVLALALGDCTGKHICPGEKRALGP